ncbi:MAG TPA: 50S ribosomal protein L6 [Deltaproteobacteria bacterium]|nr:50S ribosomal protein L6 [Deltaproteobacteria bacterium]
MSRIGKEPIPIPEKVAVAVENGLVKVEGPKGALERPLPRDVDITIDDGKINVARRADNRRGRAFQGLARTLLFNMVQGVSKGYEKRLEIVGVGYRGEIEGSTLKLLLGFSKPVEYPVPDGITVSIEKQVGVTISGIDKEMVGRVASEIRALKKPEPYKGKGIRYAGEAVRRKVGKSAGA